MTTDYNTIEDYLAHVGACRDQAFGKRFRNQFRDTRGTAELAMLAAPSEEEYQSFCRLVAVMTDQEKHQPQLLTDQQIHTLARRADIDPGLAAIFVNGYVLKISKAPKGRNESAQGNALG